jgi:NAD(P)-dependent dehydrogenase (short-subunit alcohol dehydrogenase family)
MNYSFENQVVLVTGGTGVLGTAVTEAFVRAGASVFVSYRSPREATVLRNQLGPHENKVTLIESDLMKEDSVSSLVETILRQFGRIDILANVVGGYAGGPEIHETREKDFDFMLNLNLKTAFLISKAVLPSMIAHKQGKIVHISSRTGLKGEATVGPYSISKAGVIRLTETIADEVADSGICCNCLMPSTMDTETNRKAMPNADFTKWLKPEEIARVILFLCSDDAKVINGAAIPVYGRA